MDWFENLRLLKSKSNMSMREIAIKSEIPEPTLEKIFSGATKSPGINTIQILVHALGYTLNDIDPNPSVESFIAEKPTADERIHIKKYRSLDTYGKEAVDSILDIEYKRCAELAKHGERPMIPAAARSGNVTEIEAIYPDELPDNEQIP